MPPQKYNTLFHTIRPEPEELNICAYLSKVCIRRVRNRMAFGRRNTVARDQFENTVYWPKIAKHNIKYFKLAIERLHSDELLCSTIICIRFKLTRRQIVR